MQKLFVAWEYYSFWIRMNVYKALLWALFKTYMVVEFFTVLCMYDGEILAGMTKIMLLLFYSLYFLVCNPQRYSP